MPQWDPYGDGCGRTFVCHLDFGYGHGCGRPFVIQQCFEYGNGCGRSSTFHLCSVYGNGCGRIVLRGAARVRTASPGAPRTRDWPNVAKGTGRGPGRQDAATYWQDEIDARAPYVKGQRLHSALYDGDGFKEQGLLSDLMRYARRDEPQGYQYGDG